MRQRRIFRPARTERRWSRAGFVALVALAGSLGIGLGLPSDLLGSAPRQAQWEVAAAEILVVDGETLRLGERTLRLHGVVAPERGQSCTDEGGRLYDCGTAAAAGLARLVADRPLLCRVTDRDRFGRVLGACRTAELDLALAMVASGWALAAEPAFMAAEAEARAVRRGLWTGGFEPPSHWRR